MPSASHDFGDKVKQGRLRPNRKPRPFTAAVGKRNNSASRRKFTNVAENYLNEHDQRQKAVLEEKKDELEDLDADLEDLMFVAADKKYNLKILNDAFEGRAHENEDIELKAVGGELKIKKRMKRPPNHLNKKNTGSDPSYFGGLESTDNPRLNAIMEEAM